MTEKSLTELGDKVDAETKAKVEEEIAALKKALEGDDVEEIKAATEKLTAASHKLAELMYSQTSQEQGGAGAAGAGAAGAAGAGAAGGDGGGASQKPKGDDDDVVDADFEEVK